MTTGDNGKSRRPTRATNGSGKDKDKDEPTSPSSPLAQFPPLPPAESRSRAPEFYGFVAWAVTCLLFVLYFLWAILPDEWIIWLGVTWYPNRCVRACVTKKRKEKRKKEIPTLRLETPSIQNSAQLPRTRATLEGVSLLPSFGESSAGRAMRMAIARATHPRRPDF
jgi:hypothetical protein